MPATFRASCRRWTVGHTDDVPYMMRSAVGAGLDMSTEHERQVVLLEPAAERRQTYAELTSGFPIFRVDNVNLSMTPSWPSGQIAVESWAIFFPVRKARTHRRFRLRRDGGLQVGFQQVITRRR